MANLIWMPAIQSVGDQTVINSSTKVTDSKVNNASEVNIQFAETNWKVKGNLGGGALMLINL